MPAPAGLRIQSSHRSRISQAESGRILSRSYGGQFYQVSLVYNPMKREDAGPIIAFLHSRKGRDSIFKVELSGLAEASGARLANFANYDDDTKLHLITKTTPSLEVTPPARASGSVLVTDTVYMRASLTRDVQEVSLGRDGLVRLELDLIERL